MTERVKIKFEVFMTSTPGVGLGMASRLIGRPHEYGYHALRDVAYASETMRQAGQATHVNTLKQFAFTALEWWARKGATVSHEIEIVLNKGRQGAPMKDWNRNRMARAMARKAGSGCRRTNKR